MKTKSRIIMFSWPDTRPVQIAHTGGGVITVPLWFYMAGLVSDRKILALDHTPVKVRVPAEGYNRVTNIPMWLWKLMEDSSSVIAEFNHKENNPGPAPRPGFWRRLFGAKPVALPRQLDIQPWEKRRLEEELQVVAFMWGRYYGAKQRSRYKTKRAKQEARMRVFQAMALMYALPTSTRIVHYT